MGIDEEMQFQNDNIVTWSTNVFDDVPFTSVVEMRLKV